MRFRSYEKLQQSGIQVRYEYYREVYLGKMQRQDTPENIRERLQKKIPKSFDPLHSWYRWQVSSTVKSM